MKLVAAVIVRNELARYLEPCLAALLEFCDEIRVFDDGSSDGWQETLRPGWGDAGSRVVVLEAGAEARDREPAFYRHAEGRNRLLAFTLAGAPTHVLAIDADEFVDDGAALREACEQPRHDAWMLCLQEIWGATPAGLKVRQDGGWVEHNVAMLWRPRRGTGAGLIIDKGHATGRVPDSVYRASTGHSCAALLHFGWANVAERQERYARYAVGDAGKFHAKAHIDSIMWGDRRVRVTGREWPSSWTAEMRTAVLERASRA